MTNRIIHKKYIWLLLITGAVYFSLRYLFSLAAPILLALLFVMIFGPFLLKLQKKLHLNRQIGAVLILLVAAGIVILLLWILFSWVISCLPDWLLWMDSFEEKAEIVIHRISATMGNTLRIDTAYLEEIILINIRHGIDWFQLEFMPGLLSQSLEYAEAIVEFGMFFLTFVIATVLLAKDYDRMMNGMLEKEEYYLVLEVLCGIVRYIATFVKAQFVIISMISFAAATVLTLAGIKQGVLWGILAGLLDALPFVGTGIVILPLAIQQFVMAHYGSAIVCVLLYVGCVFIREFSEPKLIGKRVGVAPVGILISIYAGIKLFGVFGIIKGPLGLVIICQIYQSLTVREQYLSRDVK